MEVNCRHCGEPIQIESADALRYVAREGNETEPATSLIVASAAAGDRLLHRCVLREPDKSNWSAA
jgi:hypothetical protein